MKLSLATEQVRIYDDFLPGGTAAALLDYAKSASYGAVHEAFWYKTWRPMDGLPLKGTTTYYRDDSGDYQSYEESRYPTGAAIDRLVEAVRDISGEADALVGRRGVKWKSFCVSPYVHARGCALSMHRDHTIYTGAFIYFAHREWSPYWGGQLLVLDPRTGAGADVDGPKAIGFLWDAGENEIVSEPGIALCVMPKPNRLVIVTENAYHMVTRVDANAGDRSRVTLSGFFTAD